MAKSKPQAGFINFRSSPELDAALDNEVHRLRREGVPPRVANRSAVARTLILGALGQSSIKLTGSEALKRVYGVVRSATERAMKNLTDDLHDLVEEELQSINDLQA